MTAEEIELSIGTKCLRCVGLCTGWMDCGVGILSRGVTRIWCQFCGGSGLLATRLCSTDYPPISVHCTAPFKTHHLEADRGTRSNRI